MLACAGSATAQSLPAPAILPDAKLVMGLHVNRALDGISDLLPPDWRAQAALALSSTPLTGFDPSRDLDEVVISSTGEGPAPPALVWLQGRFPVSELAEIATLTERGVPLLRAGPGGGAIAFPNVNTALAGEEALVRAALERFAKAVPPTAGLAERVAELRAKYDVWGFGTRPETAALPESAADAIKSLDGGRFGASFRNGLEASFRFDVRSAQDTAKLTMAAELLETMLKSQPATKASQFQVKSEGKSIRIEIAIPRQEWKQALAGQREALTRALSQQLHGSALPPSTLRLEAPKRPPAHLPPAAQPVVKPATRILGTEDGATVIVTLPGHH
ncbi:MAG: hypothetical protein ABSH56_34260 [Bryobacteraceae bacterium]